MLALSVISMAIFSAYMLYDLKRIMDGGETNYISATLALYLDIINVFQALHARGERLTHIVKECFSLLRLFSCLCLKRFVSFNPLKHAMRFHAPYAEKHVDDPYATQ